MSINPESAPIFREQNKVGGQREQSVKQGSSGTFVMSGMEVACVKTVANRQLK